MAILTGPGGINPNGRAGGFVFYQLNGRTIMRRLPDSHRNRTHPTPLQLLFRRRFKEINAFLAPFKRVLNFGFQNQCTQSKKGTHCAYQELAQKGYTFGQEPPIDPAYLKISSGTLLGPEEVGISRNDLSIQLSWRDQANQGSSFQRAMVMVFLLHPETGNHYWFTQAGHSTDLSLSVRIKDTDRDRSWCAYLCFYRKTRGDRFVFSDSVYGGRV